MSFGRQLQSLLKEVYPLNKDISSFVARIDNAFMAEGVFSEIVYESTINYMMRRLIKTSEYIKNKNRFSPDDKYIEEIRKYLKNYTNIPKDFTGRVLLLLIDCLKATNQDPSKKDAKILLDKAKKESLRCYICGQELGFSQSGEYNSAEVEHVFPKSLGGSSDISNLKIACHRCNQIKTSHISSDDFHYEFISLSQHKDDENFSKEFSWEYRIALYLRSGCKCVVCGKEARTEGKLNLARIELNDSWHFLNIEAYCDKHTSE
jgi:ribosomal protein S14